MQDAIIMYENGKAIGGEGHPTNASDITFNNSNTDLVSENVEGAIKEVYGNSAKSADLTSISERGSTASQTISAGTYFYLNGTLVRAKNDIASGATFTENTNYEVITAGALNAIKEVKSVEMTMTTTASGNITLGTGWLIGGGKEVISAVAKRDATTLLVSNANNYYLLNARSRDNWTTIQGTSITFILFYTES